MNYTGRLLGAALALAAVTPCPAASQSTGEAVAFDNVVLELTPQRIARVVAGKNAAMRLATGPNSPSAMKTKLDAEDARQAVIYNKHVEDINAWDQKYRDTQDCRDSVLSAIADKNQMDTNPQFLQKMTQLSLAYAQAQLKGDTAEMRRLAAELQNAKLPTRADSLQAARACGAASAPAIVQQWLDIKRGIDSLGLQIGNAEQAILDAEQSGSGMNARQLAIACERIRIFLARQKEKKKQSGFTAAELQALDQASKDLDSICK